jgi:hypothetical protein
MDSAIRREDLSDGGEVFLDAGEENGARSGCESPVAPFPDGVNLQGIHPYRREKIRAVHAVLKLITVKQLMKTYMF